MNFDWPRLNAEYDNTSVSTLRARRRRRRQPENQAAVWKDAKSTARRVHSEGASTLRLIALIGAIILSVGSTSAFAQAQRADSGERRQRRERTPCWRCQPVDARSLDEPLCDEPGPRVANPAAPARRNLLAPLGWDTNPEPVQSGGMPTWETSPLGSVSLSAPIGAPFRFTASGFGELNTFFLPPTSTSSGSAARRAAIRRPQRRPGFLALCCDRAEAAMGVGVFRASGGPTGFQRRIQQAVQFRRRLSAPRHRLRHVGRDGLVVRPDRIRTATRTRSASSRPTPCS